VVLAGLVAAIVAVMVVGADASVAQLFGIVAPAQSLATIGAIWYLAAESERRRRHLGLTIHPQDGWGLLIGAGLQVVLAAAMYPFISLLFEDEIPVQEIVEAADRALSSGDRFLVAVSAVILAPVAEELAFRGVLLAALRERVTDRWSVILSASAFAAFHLLDPNAVLAAPPLFVLGLVMARQVVRSGRIAAAIFTHMGFNLVSVIALFLTG
jgi:membrane protease YdiL (CAAX protease family)